MIAIEALAELDVPGPTHTALSAPFWDAAERGELVVQRCRDCKAAIFYPRRICPYCWCDDLSFEPVSGRGALRTWSTIVRPGHFAWVPAAPYAIGLVALEEGPTLLTQLRAEPEGLSAGLPMRVVFVRVGGHTLPLFEPVP